MTVTRLADVPGQGDGGMYMTRIRGDREAFGRPDIPQRWTQGGKDVVCIALAVCFPRSQHAPVRFTFFRTMTGRWEGRDYEVAVDGDAV